MGVLNIYHPDIEDFVTAKSREAGKLNHFNLSVMVDDEFMKAVQQKKNIILHWPVYNEDGGIEYDSSKWKITKEISACELWDKIMRNAYNNGEPGIFFYDNINNDNNLWYAENIICSNPCAEYLAGTVYDSPKSAAEYGGACNLGSLMLHSFVTNPFTKNARFDFASLDDKIHAAIRMLDNIITKNTFPNQIYENYQYRFRTIGLGYTGLADTLVMLGYHYNSPEGREFVGNLTDHIAYMAYRSSIELAKEKGSFPGLDTGCFISSEFLLKHARNSGLDWGGIIKDIRDYGIRNAKLLSVAPAGTMSLVFGNNCSSGIEPIFSLEYERKVKIGGQQEKDTKTVKVQDYAYQLYNHLKESNADVVDNPPFITALDISVDDHINMLANIAFNVDMSVSKTINVPTDYPYEKCKDIYTYCWENGIKGCTIFRPNELRQGVLIADSSKQEKKERENYERGYIIGCSDNLVGIKRKLMTGCGSMHLMAWYDPDTKDIMEVFAGRGSSGGCEKNLAAMTRLISLSLRGGVPFEKVIDQLDSCGGCSAYNARRISKHDTSKGSSCATAIAAALIDIKKEIDGIKYAVKNGRGIEITGELQSDNTPKCPECGAELNFEGGCNICKSCGWSKCG